MIDSQKIQEQWTRASDEHTLLDARFTKQEAREVLNAFLDSAINARKIQNLRTHIHSQIPDEASLRSIEDLEQKKAYLSALLRNMDEQGIRVRLHAAVDAERAERSLARTG